MKCKLEKLKVVTRKQMEFVDITEKVRESVLASTITSGVATVFSPHTTASVKINHNEPMLLQDFMNLFYRIVPMDINYSHDLFEIRTGLGLSERSNGHAHVKALLMGSSETLPVSDGKLVLGPKQSVFFLEFDGGRERTVYVQVQGE
ncbi:MAG: secondary thiamine-phosphate synthase enzyme YjbQ [Candidatus Saccharibacteria bacterium]